MVMAMIELPVCLQGRTTAAKQTLQRNRVRMRPSNFFVLHISLIHRNHFIYNHIELF